MALTKISRSLLDTGVSDSSDATAITITSDENVGIGTSTINTGTLGTSNKFLEVAAGTASGSGTLVLSRDTSGNDNEVGGIRFVNANNADDDGLDADGKFVAAISARSVTSDTNASDDSGANLVFYTKPEAGNYAERMRVTSGGDVGIGITSPNEKLQVGGSVMVNNGAFYKFGDGTVRIYGETSSDIMSFVTNDSERMRIDSSGNVLFGKTSLDTGTQGTEIKTGLVNITNSGAQCITINRLNSNGTLILFQQDNTTEGNISVSGTNVSYNGFTGTHESSGIASDTAIGTVCSTIDELDTYVSGNKEGQERTDHAKIKVSDTVGDARVYGVLSSYSETDNKPIVASVGIGSVLVTGACEGGDLLESNGDGTAKVQDDDIIRSKTIGKVTIGNSDTNVKLVSCVLYCG